MYRKQKLFIEKKQFYDESLCLNDLSIVAEPEPVEPKLFGDREPEPKINLKKHFLQSV